MARVKRAFSLVELLVVIAILVVLAALLLPVLFAAQKRSGTAVCTSNLHQAGTSMLLYLADHDGQLPRLLFADVRPLRPYLKSDAVWRCPVDPFELGANRQAAKGLGSPVSPFPPVTLEPVFMEALEGADSNHGLLACLVHGERLVRGALPHEPLNGYRGKVMVVTRDGAVRTKQVAVRCFEASSGERSEGRLWWDFFTDEPPPAEVLLALTGAESVVPCPRGTP